MNQFINSNTTGTTSTNTNIKQAMEACKGGQSAQESPISLILDKQATIVAESAKECQEGGHQQVKAMPQEADDAVKITVGANKY